MTFTWQDIYPYLHGCPRRSVQAIEPNLSVTERLFLAAYKVFRMRGNIADILSSNVWSKMPGASQASHKIVIDALHWLASTHAIGADTGGSYSREIIGAITATINIDALTKNSANTGVDSTPVIVMFSANPTRSSNEDSMLKIWHTIAMWVCFIMKKTKEPTTVRFLYPLSRLARDISCDYVDLSPLLRLRSEGITWPRPSQDCASCKDVCTFVHQIQEYR